MYGGSYGTIFKMPAAQKTLEWFISLNHFPSHKSQLSWHSKLLDIADYLQVFTGQKLQVLLGAAVMGEALILHTFSLTILPA